MSAEELPYCIWYPDIAMEETYRLLANVHSAMRYQAARACAVAGYTKLYHELESAILPDVSIAEEARESGNLEIFESIMSHPVLFNVMNDYTRTINMSSPRSAQLNGDTAVRTSLDYMQAFEAPSLENDGDDLTFNLFEPPSLGFEERMFNITEDQGIANPDMLPDDSDDGSQANNDYFNNPTVPQAPAWVEYLWSPLPHHLPFLEKNMLILKAAYDGNIDRYARLHRPAMIFGELDCCLRGIYHNTMFAVWWSKQDLSLPSRRRMQDAVDARFIMNNVLREDISGTPYLIWYPTIAKVSTYRELANRRPDMLPQVVRACIVADYQELFDELTTRLEHVDEAVLREAKRSFNGHYLAKLQECLRGQPAAELTYDDWRNQIVITLMRSQNWIRKDLANRLSICNDSGRGLYGGFWVDDAKVDMYACLPKEWLLPPKDDYGYLPEWQIDYIEFTQTAALQADNHVHVIQRVPILLSIFAVLKDTSTRIRCTN